MESTQETFPCKLNRRTPFGAVANHAVWLACLRGSRSKRTSLTELELFKMFWYKLNMLRELPSSAVSSADTGVSHAPQKSKRRAHDSDEESEEEDVAHLSGEMDIEVEINVELDGLVPADAGENVPQPDMGRETVGSFIDPTSPFKTVLATASNMLCWLRYDVLRNSPNRGYESLMFDAEHQSDRRSMERSILCRTFPCG